MDQRQAAGLVVGIEHVDQLQQLLRRHRWPDLDRDRIADAAEILDVRAIERRGAHPDPREMRAEVEPAPLPRHLPGLRFLVRQQQRFVRGVEIDAVEVVHFAAGERLHEAHRIADAGDHVVVFVGKRRMRHPAEIPVLGMVQVGETAVDQRAHEVHRHRRTRVRLDHAARIRDARRGGEFRRIDDVAAIARQRRAVDRLGVGRTRLGVLAGETTDADHRHAQPVHQHQAHLQQHLEPVGNDVGIALAETFRAIATLQQEALAFLRLGQMLLQRHDFPRRHQRRQRAQFALHRRASSSASGYVGNCIAGRSRQLDGDQPSGRFTGCRLRSVLGIMLSAWQSERLLRCITA